MRCHYLPKSLPPLGKVAAEGGRMRSFFLFALARVHARAYVRIYILAFQARFYVFLRLITKKCFIPKQL